MKPFYSNGFQVIRWVIACGTCAVLTTGAAQAQEPEVTRPVVARPSTATKPVLKPTRPMATTVKKPAPVAQVATPVPAVPADTAATPTVVGSVETETAEVEQIAMNRTAEMESNVQLLLDALHSKDGEMARLRQEIEELAKDKEQLRQDVEALRGQLDRVRTETEATAREQDHERLAMAYNLGCIYKAAREYRKAETSFLRAIEIDPNDAPTHYNLAILYDDDLKDRAKARQYYERFLELAPDDADAAQVREWLSAMR